MKEYSYTQGITESSKGRLRNKIVMNISFAENEKTLDKVASFCTDTIQKYIEGSGQNGIKE